MTPPRAGAGNAGDTESGDESVLETVIDDAEDTHLDLSFAGPEPVPATPWPARWLDVASAYLPLATMAAFAAATWWLVQNAPRVDVAEPARAARSDPDYEMTGFRIQRFAPDGRLRTEIEGDRLRHFPASDTLEIDGARIRSIDAAGVVTLARARRALSNGDGSEVQLIGDAEVVRAATASEEAVRFQGEFLHALRNVEQVRSHLPVVVTQGETVVRAGGMQYDHLARVVNLTGRVVATLPARRDPR